MSGRGGEKASQHIQSRQQSMTVCGSYSVFWTKYGTRFDRLDICQCKRIVFGILQSFLGKSILSLCVYFVWCCSYKYVDERAVQIVSLKGLHK